MAPKKASVGASSSKDKGVAVTASNVKVKLQGKAEKAKWNNLTPLEFVPSRYPCYSTIRGLGIESIWREMCAVGKFNSFFYVPEKSYKALTLEFLNTMQVKMYDNEPETLTFRLQNNNFYLSVDDINTLQFPENGLASNLLPNAYDRSEFWNAITISEGEDTVFQPNRAKINHVRNPTLRYMIKAIVCLPFARAAAGTM